MDSTTRLAVLKSLGSCLSCINVANKNSPHWPAWPRHQGQSHPSCAVFSLLCLPPTNLCMASSYVIPWGGTSWLCQGSRCKSNLQEGYFFRAVLWLWACSSGKFVEKSIRLTLVDSCSLVRSWQAGCTLAADSHFDTLADSDRTKASGLRQDLVRYRQASALIALRTNARLCRVQTNHNFYQCLWQDKKATRQTNNQEEPLVLGVLHVKLSGSIHPPIWNTSEGSPSCMYQKSTTAAFYSTCL